MGKRLASSPVCLPTKRLKEQTNTCLWQAKIQFIFKPWHQDGIPFFSKFSPYQKVSKALRWLKRKKCAQTLTKEHVGHCGS